jgi:outer membrane lipoprotein-sorting protein
VPNAETTPIPETLTGRCTDRTLPSNPMHAGRLIRWCSCLTIVLLFWTRGGSRELDAQTPSAGAPGQTFDQLYQRGQQINKNLRTLTARFVETTTSSLLEKPLVERGVLYVERPSRVAMVYTDPMDRRIVIDGKWMTTSWPSRNISQRLDIGAAQERVQKYFVQSDAGELRRIFTIDLRDRSARAGTREVVLVPKRKQISETLSQLELWVDPDNALMKAMRMTFANGDTKLLDFDNVQPNGTIDPAIFATTR